MCGPMRMWQPQPVPHLRRLGWRLAGTSTTYNHGQQNEEWINGLLRPRTSALAVSWQVGPLSRREAAGGDRCQKRVNTTSPGRIMNEIRHIFLSSFSLWRGHLTKEAEWGGIVRTPPDERFTGGRLWLFAVPRLPTQFSLILLFQYVFWSNPGGSSSCSEQLAGSCDRSTPNVSVRPARKTHG